MSEPTIEQMNVAIARFENRKFFGKYTIDDYGSNHWLKYPEMKYHSSWDWLMNAWLKLRKTVWEIFGEYPADFCSISDAWEHYCFIVDIEGAHDVLHKAIQWYNKQKEANNE